MSDAESDTRDDLQYVTDRIADANEATAKTVTQAAALTTARNPFLSLWNVHDELTDWPRQRPMIEGIHVRNGFDPDELLLVPVDTPDTAIGET